MQQKYEAEHLSFEMKHELTDIQHLAFSQRRYIGFRGRQEFEKKRIVIGNGESYSVIGYDHRKHVYELLRQSVSDPENQEIRFVSFLEDSQPYYLLILVYDKIQEKTNLQIMEIKKNQKVRDEILSVYEKIEQDSTKIKKIIQDGI